VRHVLELGKYVDDFGETKGASFVQNCVLLLEDGKAVQGTYHLQLPVFLFSCSALIP
jgi:hypothetical protein